MARFLGALLLCILPSLRLAAAATAGIPETPAGHALASWLDAFNSGDSARFATFAKVHAPWLTPDRQMTVRARTGGYDLVSIEGSGKLWIVFHVRGRASPAPILGSIVVPPNDPGHISLLDLVPAESRSEEIVLDGHWSRARCQSGSCGCS